MFRPKKTMTEDEARSKLSALCARGEYCEYDMTEKMRKWGVEPAAQMRVLDFLIENKYVEQERFCRSFVKDKLYFNHWGRRKIEQALWQKRVDRRVFIEVLDEIDSKEYVLILKDLLKSKRKSIKADNAYEMNGKLIRFALSRGFTMDIIRQCIHDVDQYDLTDEQLPLPSY